MTDERGFRVQSSVLPNSEHGTLNSELAQRVEGRVAKKSMIVKAERKPRFAVQKHSRCKLCGRPRAYMRKFGMCRICFRELASAGKIPGVVKSSW